jgi:hypothetical protein
MPEENFDQNFTWHEWTFVAPAEPADDRTPDTWAAVREMETYDIRLQSDLTLFFDAR